RLRLRSGGGEPAGLHEGEQRIDMLAMLPAEETAAFAGVELVFHVEEHIVLFRVAVAVVGLGQTEGVAEVALERHQSIGAGLFALMEPEDGAAVAERGQRSRAGRRGRVFAARLDGTADGRET